MNSFRDKNCTNLRQQLEDYKGLINILQAFSSTLKTNIILQHMVDGVIDLCRARQASIMLFDPVGSKDDRTLIPRGNLKKTCWIIISIPCWQDGSAGTENHC